jgi:hypothetical protein
MNREQRRAAGHHRPRKHGELGTLDGVPVFDGTVSGAVVVDFGRGPDTRVVLGIGPAGRDPIAYVALCPCEGVDGLVQDLTEAADEARPLHPPHAGDYTGSKRCEAPLR